MPDLRPKPPVRDVAGRVDWVDANLANWTPQPGHYDLVACLYVHVPGSVEEIVRRIGAAVAPGGTLLLVGHRPVDPATAAATPAGGQVQVPVELAVAALDPHRWEVDVVEDRRRAAASTGVDAVIRARRLFQRRTAPSDGARLPTSAADCDDDLRLLGRRAERLLSVQ